MPKGFRPCGSPAFITASKIFGVSSVLEWISQPSSPANDTRTSWHQVPRHLRRLMRKPRLTQIRIGDGRQDLARFRTGQDQAGERFGPSSTAIFGAMPADAPAIHNHASCAVAAVIRKKKSSSSAISDISVTMRPLPSAK
jgi:hypothetical protein